MATTASTARPWFPGRDRRAQIWAIALPIMGGMLSQNVLNLVDAGMVGRLGDTALAAAGLGSFANYLAISFILGLATGVQALAARRLGEGKTDETAIPLNGGLMLALMIGVPLSLLLYWQAPNIMTLLNSDPAVVEQGTPYYRMRLLGMVAVGMNFSFRGYWSAVHLTRLYLRTIVAMHILNVFLNWVLIFGNLGAPEMGVVGAGLATSISLIFGTFLYFYLGWKHARKAGFIERLPSRQTLWEQLKLSLPSSLQQLLFSGGMVMLLWILGRIGTQEVAAAHVLITFTLVAILPAMGIGIAAATLVGNALGRDEPEDARQWGWNAASLAAVYGLIIAVLLFALGDPVLKVFLTNPETHHIALVPLYLMAAVLVIDLAAMVIMNALFGAGDTRTPAIISIVGQWAIFLPLAWLVGPVLGYGLTGVWFVQGLYRLGQAVLLLAAWKKGRWAKIKI